MLYGELATWYSLIDPPEEHRDEAMSFEIALLRTASPEPRTLLDLGSGAGHNVLHLKHRFQCTLTDPSEPMLALSRRLNPECEHLAGNMRTLQLGRVFDAVLVHDAIMYMTSEEDLLAAAATAFAHTRRGGAAVFAPDITRETFRESSDNFSADHGAQALRGLEWTWDPDPSDSTFVTDYTFLLRDGTNIRAVYDRHTEGLFSKATWQQILAGVGYRVDTFERPIAENESDEIFICYRP